MSDRFFLDTNIFVYALSRSAPSKRLTASRLVDQAIESGKGIVSFQVVQEFFSVAFRLRAEFKPRAMRVHGVPDF